MVFRSGNFVDLPDSLGEVETAEAAVLALLGLAVIEELLDVDEAVELLEVAVLDPEPEAPVPLEPVGVAEHPAACGRLT